MNRSADFRMNSDSEDRERLGARLRANARDFGRTFSDTALITILASLMFQAQQLVAGRGRAR